MQQAQTFNLAMARYGSFKAGDKLEVKPETSQVGLTQARSDFIIWQTAQELGTVTLLSVTPDERGDRFNNPFCLILTSDGTIWTTYLDYFRHSN